MHKQPYNVKVFVCSEPGQIKGCMCLACKEHRLRFEVYKLRANVATMLDEMLLLIRATRIRESKLPEEYRKGPNAIRDATKRLIDTYKSILEEITEDDNRINEEELLSVSPRARIQNTTTRTPKRTLGPNALPHVGGSHPIR